MADSKTEASKKGKLEDLAPFRLGEPNPDAVERARKIKRRQKERGTFSPIPPR
jgi:hypothetical protein